MVLMFAIQLRFASQNLWSVQAVGVAELHTNEHEEFGTHRQNGEPWRTCPHGLGAEYCTQSTGTNSPFSLSQCSRTGLREGQHNLLLCWKDFLENFCLPDGTKHKHGQTYIIFSKKMQQRTHQAKSRAYTHLITTSSFIPLLLSVQPCAELFKHKVINTLLKRTQPEVNLFLQALVENAQQP